MFQGPANVTLDSKGRFGVPARYRPSLTGIAEDHVVCTVHPDRCVLIYLPRDWARVSDALMRQTGVRDVQRLIVGFASETSLDAAGRLRVPPELRKYCELERHATLLALGHRFEHEPALVQETLDGLAVAPSGLYVDATFGRGGHSRAILEALGGDGRLLALDCDPEAVREARLLERQEPRFSIEHSNFRRLEQILEEKGWRGHVSGMLFDLGVSLPQLTDPLRGFSLHSGGPLDMRMTPDTGFSASDWLNGASADEIARVLRHYGEEPQARKIAQAICRRRPISRCSELAGLVAGVKRAGKPGQHPATRTFMALRIVVNEELAALEEALPQAVRCLRAGGRLCVISFHSLEDRIVKRYVRDASRLPPQLVRLPRIPNSAQPLLRTIGKLQRPSGEERARNPRARSARLRVAERLGETAGS